MALRKKLYYDLVFGSTALAGASLTQQIRAFMAGSGSAGGSSVNYDRYGNLMQPNAYQVPGGGTNVFASGGLTAQAIGAWFALSNTSGNQRTFAVDFLPFNAASVNSIDPATRYRSRVRIRVTPAFSSGSAISLASRGTLYIQRQHSIEV